MQQCSIFAVMYCTCCSFQTEKWAKPGDLPESFAFSEIGDHWMEKLFHFSIVNALSTLVFLFFFFTESLFFYSGAGVAQSIQWLGYEPNCSGFESGKGQDILCLPKHVDRLWGPSNLIVKGYRGAPSPRIKWPRREADQFHLLWKLRMGGAVPPFPVCLHGVCRESFIIMLFHGNV